MSLLLASILFAATAAGPVIGPENLSPPMGAPPAYDIAGPSSAAVRDRDGFLLAFAAQSASSPRTHIFVTRLDAAGRMIEGDLHEMPVASDAADAVLPSIVAVPDGYYVGQMEIGVMRTGIVWRINPTLPPPAIPFARLSGSPAFIRGGDGKLFAIADSRIFEYTLDGRLVDFTPATIAADDAVVVGGKALLAGHYSQPPQVCAMPPPVCGGPPAGYNVLAGFDFPPVTWTNFDFVSRNGVGAASDSATLLTAFYAGDPRLGGDVKFARFDAATFTLREDPRRLGSFDGDPLQQPMRPAAAYDGHDYLVVWQNGHAVNAAAIDAGGNVTGIALPHLGEETMPNVVAASRGRFLLSYETRRNGEWRLATRMIYLELGRRPAARR